MFELEKLVRKNILELKPYSSARDEFSGKDGIFLDANENPFGELNRYPDPYQKELKSALSKVKGVNEQNIFIGNGSDEVIDLVYRIFCNPGIDKSLSFTPTYGMYEVSANINDVIYIKLPLNEYFQIDNESLTLLLKDEKLKLIFVCSPNNPTGNVLNNIEYLLENFNGIVVVDEAYADFCNLPSWSQKINQFSNLIVMQTFSKARGLAGARVGIAYASVQIISLMNKVKPPYNVSALNQQAALSALINSAIYEKQKKEILEQRTLLETELNKLNCIKKIYPSDANFILVEVCDANGIYEFLVSHKIITRNRNSVVRNCIRITVGTAEENKQLIQTLKEFTA
jgi:histidinol-phosphate aminotransferase